jgi:hypothetical protein
VKPEHLNQKLVERAMAINRHTYFTGSIKNYNLNIVAIRHRDTRITNKFDDVYTVSWFFNNQWNFHSWACTTDPGTYYSQIKLLNPEGVAILKEGQYRHTWQLGSHRRSYRALVQRMPVKVYRDGNKDAVMDFCPSKVRSGWYGINHHRAQASGLAQFVNTHSAGCQVIQDSGNFDTLIRLCEAAAKNFGNSFTYTLLREEDVF